jgi:putative ABC transport system permease protein
MIKVSLRNLLANKLRLFLTVAAVTVGVAFVSGTFVLSDTMGKAFDNLYAGLTSGTDVVVRAEAAYDLDVTTGAQRRPLEEDVVTTVSRVPGVEVARGGVAGFALILDKQGEPIQPGGAPTIGSSIGDPRLSADFSYRAGRAPAGADEVAIDAGTVKKAGFDLGDRVDVLHQGGRRTFTLVGVVGFGDTDSLLGATLAAFDLPTAQDVLGKPGLVDEVDVKAAPGTSAAQLRDSIAQALPDGVETLTGAQVAADGSASVRDAMGIFTKVLLVFAGVSLLVGSFVIWNTFNVLVAQRRREVALLRAVGATRRQVLAGVLTEAALIGLGSGIIGLFAGVGLSAGIRWLLKLTGTELPTTTPAIEPRTVIASFGIGLVVTMLAATAPAWSATAVSPMEALRDAVPSTSAMSTIRRSIGWALVSVGAAGLVWVSVIGNLRWWTVVATAVTFAGLVVIGPTLARAIAALAGHGRRGGGWRVASRNIARNSRRAAATALALTIGLTVVAAVSVAASSMSASVSDAVAGGNRSDLILQPAGIGSGITPVAADLLRSRQDVADVVELRESSAQVNGKDVLLSGIGLDGLRQVIDLGVETGSLDALRPGHILVSVQEAERLGVGAGDSLRLTYPETGPTEVLVAGTFSKGSLINASYVVPLTDYAANVGSPLDAAIMISNRPGTDPAHVKAAVKTALAAYPNITVSDPAELTASVQESVDQLLGLVTALLLLAVIVAVLGIVNTLALSVVERTRELGLMRAVGATRRQVRSMVRRESVLMSLLGALTGVALGVGSGVALSRALLEEGLTTVSVPSGTLAIYLLVATAVGVLAAIGPARRASRVDVLRSITSE